jgi:uncharacterized protein (DUF4415 family)
MSTIKRASLDSIRAMKEAGRLHHDPDAPAGGEDLGADFWAKATLDRPKSPPHSVHLKLDPEVFDFFKRQGKGHLTRMQDILRAYVRAHTQPH